MSRSLYYESDQLLEGSGTVKFDNTSLGGSENTLYSVWYQPGSGPKFLVWAKSATVVVNNLESDVDMYTYIWDSLVAQGKQDSLNITVQVLAGTKVGKLIFDTNIPSDWDIELYNFGEIQGSSGTPGVAGGDAIVLNRPVKIINNGWIRGGGGAGGRGGDGLSGAAKNVSKITYTLQWPEFSLTDDSQISSLINPNHLYVQLERKFKWYITDSVFTGTRVYGPCLSYTPATKSTSFISDSICNTSLSYMRYAANISSGSYTKSSIITIDGYPGGTGGTGGNGEGFNPVGASLRTSGDLGLPGESFSSNSGFAEFNNSTTTTTWTVPSGVTSINLHMTGPGGSSAQYMDGYPYWWCDTCSWTPLHNNIRTVVQECGGTDIVIGSYSFLTGQAITHDATEPFYIQAAYSCDKGCDQYYFRDPLLVVNPGDTIYLREPGVTVNGVTTPRPDKPHIWVYKNNPKRWKAGSAGESKQIYNIPVTPGDEYTISVIGTGTTSITGPGFTHTCIKGTDGTYLGNDGAKAGYGRNYNDGQEAIGHITYKGGEASIFANGGQGNSATRPGPGAGGGALHKVINPGGYGKVLITWGDYDQYIADGSNERNPGLAGGTGGTGGNWGESGANGENPTGLGYNTGRTGGGASIRNWNTYATTDSVLGNINGALT